MDNRLNGEPQAKRRRVTKDKAFEADRKPAITVSSAKDLHTLLGPKACQGSDARTGLQAFKAFLQSIGDAEDSLHTKKLQILKAYLEEQSPEKAGATICLPDLIATWNSAVESKNDSILSTVPSVLALLLKVISTDLGFREYGLAISKDLIQKDQLRLLDRGLTATKTKEHLISPCIRLLTEIVSFDGGAVAGLVYAKRETTFKRIDQFLQQRNDEQAEKDPRRPSLRRIAQRYVLANLKYQTDRSKADLITQHNIFRAFLQGIKSDSGDIILDILTALEQNVAKDSSLTRNQKQRFWSYSILSALTTLYSFVETDSEENTSKVQEQTHGLLRLLCTSQTEGILRRQAGWYPHGMNPETQILEGSADDYIDLGLDSRISIDRHTDRPPIKNTQLSAFIQSLRTDNPLQTELLLDVFKAAPELVADYFSKKTFPMEPKATPQWLGFSALIFSSIRIPVPENCGWSGDPPIIPPPVSVVIENILPHPLDRMTMIRCLNLNHEIMTLFVVRALSAAFEKLDKVLSAYHRCPESVRASWQQAASKVIEAFGQRCPPMKDVIATYHRTSKTDPSLNAAVVELIAAYYRGLPDVAMAEKFDVSVALVEVLIKYEASQEPAEKQDIIEQLTHLLVIAQTSSDTKWWNKPESLAYSLYMSLLRLTAIATGDDPTIQHIRAILTEISIENGIVGGRQSFDALLGALRGPERKGVVETPIFQAIDQCVSRLAKRPVQYQDFTSQIQQNSTSTSPLSLLAAVLTEQFQFVTQSTGQKTFAGWLRQFFHNLEVVEDAQSIENLRLYLMKSRSGSDRKELEKIFSQSANPWSERLDVYDIDTAMADLGSEIPADVTQTEDILSSTFHESTTGDGLPLSVLQKWERQNVEEAISTGTVIGLIKCMGSEESEIRRQAFISIQRFTHKLKDSDYMGWQAIFVLLGELIETTTSIGLDRRIPTIVTELGAQCMEALTQPLSKVFAKVNRFLNKAPLWTTSKLSSYWIDQLLLQEPEHDDGYIEEATWLLQLLLASLKTPEDLELYRKAKVFERLLTWSQSPGVPNYLRQRLLELVYRAAVLDTGNALVTRTGLLNWLEEEEVKYGDHGKIAGALRQMVKVKLVPDEFIRWAGISAESV